MGHLHRVMPVVSVGLGLLLSTANTASPAPFVQTNLVSDIAGLATITEPTLVNPWGVSHTVTSPFWISDQGANLTNLWSVTGPTTVAKVPLSTRRPAISRSRHSVLDPPKDPPVKSAIKTPASRAFRWEWGGTAVPRTSSLRT
jgi:hypothetical protein